jgi:hypothetical protein
MRRLSIIIGWLVFLSAGLACNVGAGQTAEPTAISPQPITEPLSQPDTDLTMTHIASSELMSNGSRRTPFNGAIDEIMIFDRAFTAEEVGGMYQNFVQYKQ